MENFGEWGTQAEIFNIATLYKFLYLHGNHTASYITGYDTSLFLTSLQ